MTTPTAIPVNGDGTYDDPTWGEGGGPFSVPASEAAGYGAVALPSNDVNYEWQHQSRWIRALRDRMVRSDDGLFTNCIVKSGSWNTGGGTLDGTLGVSRLIVDASSDGGVMVEISIPAGSPHTFTANRDTYVSANESGALEYQAVPNGDPAPTPSAGYVAFWRVVTDGTELTSATALVPTIPTLGTIRLAGPAQFGNSITVANGATITAGGLTVSAGGAAITGNSTITGDIDITGSATIGDGAGDSHTITGDLIDIVTDVCAIGSSSADTLNVFSTATFQSPVSFNGNVTLGNASGDSITVTGTVASSIAMGGNGITGAGGITCSSLTVNNAGGANCASLVGDATSPTKAALYLAGQDADASSPAGAGGDLMFNSTLDRLRFYNQFDGWNTIHMSPKGRVDTFTAGTSGTTVNSGNLATTTIGAEAVGTVLLEASGLFEMPGVGDTFDLLIRDVTAGSTVATVTVEVAAAGEATSEILRAVYTLPAAGSRQFAMQVNGNGATNVTRSACVLSVRGVN